MTNELTINAEQYGLEPSKAQQIEMIFIPMVSMLKDVEQPYNEIISSKNVDKSLVGRAKRLRLDISKIRINADKAHKSAKEESLRVGKAIDGVRNIIKYAVTDKEEKLKGIENHFENLEAERISKLQSEREVLISEYEIDGTQIALGEMDIAVWDNFFAGSKSNFLAKIAAEQKAEAERIAIEKEEIERQEKIRKDNERLRAEIAEKEKIRIEEERKQQKEREEYERRIRAEQAEKEKIERENQAIIRKQQAEQDRIDQEKTAQLKAEREREKYLRAAPDREKLAVFLTDIDNLNIPSFSDASISFSINLKINELRDLISTAIPNPGEIE